MRPMPGPHLRPRSLLPTNTPPPGATRPKPSPSSKTIPRPSTYAQELTSLLVTSRPPARIANASMHLQAALLTTKQLARHERSCGARHPADPRVPRCPAQPDVKASATPASCSSGGDELLLHARVTTTATANSTIQECSLR